MILFLGVTFILSCDSTTRIDPEAKQNIGIWKTSIDYSDQTKRFFSYFCMEGNGNYNYYQLGYADTINFTNPYNVQWWIGNWKQANDTIVSKDTAYFYYKDSAGLGTQWKSKIRISEKRDFSIIGIVSNSDGNLQLQRGGFTYLKVPKATVPIEIRTDCGD